MLWPLLCVRTCLLFISEDTPSQDEPNTCPTSFWLNVIGLCFLLALPIYYNLTFYSAAGEPKLDRFFRAFGASMDSFFLGIEVLAVIQVLFIANVLWSVFKGERTSRLVNA